MSSPSSSSTVDRELFLTHLAQLRELKKHKPIFNREEIQAIIAEIKSAQNKDSVKSSREYHLVREYHVMKLDGRERLVRTSKNPRTDPPRLMISFEDYFDALESAHLSTTHGGRDKMRLVLNSQYANVTTEAVSLFLDMCDSCSQRRQSFRSLRSGGQTSAETTESPCQSDQQREIKLEPIDADERTGQIDIIDYQFLPDGAFSFIFHYRDSTTHFSRILPLRSVTTDELADALIDVFCTIGVPALLDCSNSCCPIDEQALVNCIRMKWPNCNVSCAAKASFAAEASETFRFRSDVDQDVLNWVRETRSKQWSSALKFIQLRKNTSFDDELGQSPYEATFGHSFDVGAAGSLDAFVSSQPTPLSKLPAVESEVEIRSVTSTLTSFDSSSAEGGFFIDRQTLGIVEGPKVDACHSYSCSRIRETELSEQQIFEMEQKWNEMITAHYSDGKRFPPLSQSSYEQRISDLEAAKMKTTTKTGREYAWLKQYEIVHDPNNFGEKRLALKHKSEQGQIVYVPKREELFGLLFDAHVRTGHGGREKILKHLSDYDIPIVTVQLFLRGCQCERCTTKRTREASKNNCGNRSAAENSSNDIDIDYCFPETPSKINDDEPTVEDSSNARRFIANPSKPVPTSCQSVARESEAHSESTTNRTDTQTTAVQYSNSLYKTLEVPPQSSRMALAFDHFGAQPSGSNSLSAHGSQQSLAALTTTDHDHVYKRPRRDSEDRPSGPSRQQSDVSGKPSFSSAPAGNLASPNVSKMVFVDDHLKTFLLPARKQ